ncbi:LADA_0H07712g1_1 [Lachancea dasiensis]|uniref:Riboflavin synthase n=1 Tax=Lachancea dasiensis TaxID=1072105 RepID=A0A1G4K267_9SACH|nr:LADA_0H07712g1_1 [Lachancea dasiensis]
MFTGIVELIGTVSDYQEYDATHSGGGGVSVTVTNASEILGDCHIGDSIAVNGICLTVTEYSDDSFKVGISPETIRRTNVSSWETGTKVNLERAVGQDVRFGGHYVQGHIDGVARITSRVPEANSIVFGFKLREKEFEKYIVEKGFICIDGTSLTITKIDDDGVFYIAMIKHTQEKVVLPSKAIGDEVNIEVDLTGKVIEKQVVLQLQDQIENEQSPLTKLVEKLVDQKLQKLIGK